MNNVRLLLVLLPLAVGYLLNRFGPIVAGVLPLLAGVFLLLWMGFGLWIFRSKVNRAFALAAGVGAPLLFLLLYLATAGTRISIYPQLYFAAVAPAAAQLPRLNSDWTGPTTMANIYFGAALLTAAAFLIGFFYGWFRSREYRQ
jgi:hypothetical protein